jgi:hypothetical protein
MFPASRSVLLAIKARLKRHITEPVIIRSRLIDTLSLKGPKTSIPAGIIRLEIMVKTLKTLPMYSGSTFDCSSVMEGVLYRGMVIPSKAITAI